MKISQVPTKGFHACMGSLTPRSPTTSHHNEAARVAFGRSENLGAPNIAFSMLISPPHEPLPTLRLTPHGGPTHGSRRDVGWLLLHHGGTCTPCLSPVRLAHQIRTCPIKASGSSNNGLAAQRYTL